jgi:hypothetical protein
MQLPRGSALSQNRLCCGTQRPGFGAKAQQGQCQSVSGSHGADCQNKEKGDRDGREKNRFDALPSGER